MRKRKEVRSIGREERIPHLTYKTNFYVLLVGTPQTLDDIDVCGSMQFIKFTTCCSFSSSLEAWGGLDRRIYPY